MSFDEPAGSYAICPVCGWEDDHVQLRHPDLAGGANRPSLWEHQRETVKRYPLGVDLQGEWSRDPTWRPADERDLQPDPPSSPVCYFDEAAMDDESPYYWRR